MTELTSYIFFYVHLLRLVHVTRQQPTHLLALLCLSRSLGPAVSFQFTQYCMIQLEPLGLDEQSVETSDP